MKKYNKWVKPTHFRSVRLCVNRTSLPPLQWSAYPERYMHMSKVIIIILALIINSSANADAESPVFVITSECITSVNIEESDFLPESGWRLIVNINVVAAAKLHAFSENNLGKKARIVDGVGNNLIAGGALIMSRISTPIAISGFKSKDKAESSKKSVLSTQGECGEK